MLRHLFQRVPQGACQHLPVISRLFFSPCLCQLFTVVDYHTLSADKRLQQFPVTKILSLTFHLSDAAPASFPWQQCPVVGLEKRGDHLHALVPGSRVQNSIQRGNTAAGSGRPVYQPAVPGGPTSDPDLVKLAVKFIHEPFKLFCMMVLYFIYFQIRFVVRNAALESFPLHF